MKNLWVSLSGAIAQQKNVETIANNIANANTPGFKKDKLVFKEHLAVFDKGINDVDLPRKEWAPEDFYRSYGAENAHVKVAASFTDHTQGQLTPTGNKLDVALRGKGFFEILTPNGLRYTRNGIFSLDAKGRLVTTKGYPVLSEYKLDPTKEQTELPPSKDRFITLSNGNISINMSGEITQNNNPLGKLSIVEFKDIHSLRKEGDGMFINRDEKNMILSTPRTTTHQGFVENSNVNAVSEMSELIKANRHFETIQRAIKAYDSMTGKGVNEIAKF